MGYELRSSEFLINTGLHNPTLSQPSTWEGREWGIVTVSRSHVHLHMELPTKATKNVFLQQHWSWTLWGGLLSPLSLPNETQSPLPRKRKKKKERKKKSQNQQVRVKHLWRWSAHSKGQRGSVSLVTAPGWLRWFNTPSSAKGTHILSVYKSYSGVQAWESLLQT